MSKWLIQGHFRQLHFDSFLMTWRTPQGEVFWPLQSNSEDLGVPKDSQVPISRVWMSSSHSSKSGVATILVQASCEENFPCHYLVYFKIHSLCLWMHIKVYITSFTPILSLSMLDIQANTFKILMKVNF
jgi:hypothetical protein